VRFMTGATNLISNTSEGNVSPPPTYANPVTTNEQTGQSTFSTAWLQWFLNIATYLTNVSNSVVTGGQLAAMYPQITQSATMDLSSANASYALILCQGGGGGGGSAPNLPDSPPLGTTPGGTAGGGGSGAMVLALVGISGLSSLTVMIGAGGQPGAAGGDTTISASSGTLLTAGGGQPGANGALNDFLARGGNGGTSSMGTSATSQGDPAGVCGTGALGGNGLFFTAASAMGGDGASSVFGQGGHGSYNDAGGYTPGTAAQGFGAGGAGSVSGGSGGLQLGTPGTPGFAFVMLYS
jgi:hypothetical protein